MGSEKYFIKFKILLILYSFHQHPCCITRNIYYTEFYEYICLKFLKSECGALLNSIW
jgi:hypothetical protein